LLDEFNGLEILEIEKCMYESLCENGLSKGKEEGFFYLIIKNNYIKVYIF